jgi:hypothetical protein
VGSDGDRDSFRIEERGNYRVSFAVHLQRPENLGVNLLRNGAPLHGLGFMPNNYNTSQFISEGIFTLHRGDVISLEFFGLNHSVSPIRNAGVEIMLIRISE